MLDKIKYTFFIAMIFFFVSKKGITQILGNEKTISMCCNEPIYDLYDRYQHYLFDFKDSVIYHYPSPSILSKNRIRMIKTYTLNSDSTKLYIATYQIDSMGRTTLIDDNTDITQIEYDHLNKVTHLNVVVKETGLQILDSNTKYDYLNSLQKTEFVMGQYHTRIQKDTTGIRISLYENKLLSSVQYYTKSTLNPYHSLSYFRYIKDTIHINTYLLNSNQNTQYRIDMKILERKRVSTRVFSSNNQIEYIGFIEFIDEMPCHFYGEYKTFPYQRWGIELEYISTTGLLKKVTNSYQGAVLSVIYYDYFH